MFNFSGSELMFLLILGLVVLGPEKLPTVLRKMGRFYGEFRRMTSDAQSDFRQAFAEPLRDLQSAATEYKSVFQDAAAEISDNGVEPIFVPYVAPVADDVDVATTEHEPSDHDEETLDILSADDEPQVLIVTYEDKK
jgi:sec-independent protein translocase protein TatB